jgi:hypothetical protein
MTRGLWILALKPFAFGQNAAPSVHFVTGAPYSAEQTGETVKTLADGARVSEPSPTVRFYRDSAGRTRTERCQRSGRPDAQLTIEITDPVARFRYTLDTAAKIAHRQPIAPIEAAPHLANGPSCPVGFTYSGPLPRETPAEPPKTTAENLGSRTIEGVPAVGARCTTVWPAGFLGHDESVTTVSETWTSPQLRVIVLIKIDDSRNGETTTRLVNVSRAEPDPALFQAPADYTIIEADF